jgi:hypothetical protein
MKYADYLNFHEVKAYGEYLMPEKNILGLVEDTEIYTESDDSNAITQ